MRQFAVADPYGGEAAGPVYGLLKGKRLNEGQNGSDESQMRMSENLSAHGSLLCF